MKHKTSDSHEEVDIVDEKDSVLYSTTKHDAHKGGLLHRTVICEVINSKGEFLLTKQSKDRQDPGQYVSPVGGHVQAGESEDDALKREAKEELGIDVAEFNLIGKAIFNRPVKDHQENHYFILYEIMSDEPFTLNHESVSYTSFTTDKLKKDLKENPKMFGDAYLFVVNTFYPHLLI